MDISDTLMLEEKTSRHRWWLRALVVAWFAIAAVLTYGADPGAGSFSLDQIDAPTPTPTPEPTPVLKPHPPSKPGPMDPLLSPSSGGGSPAVTDLTPTPAPESSPVVPMLEPTPAPAAAPIGTPVPGLGPVDVTPKPVHAVSTPAPAPAPKAVDYTGAGDVAGDSTPVPAATPKAVDTTASTTPAVAPAPAVAVAPETAHRAVATAPSPVAASSANEVPLPEPAPRVNTLAANGSSSSAVGLQPGDEGPPASDAVLFAQQTTASAPAPAPNAPSQNVTINLINRLVQRGVLSKEDASDLIRQAEMDAEVARKQAVADATAAAQAAAPAPADDDTVRVAYVPDVVKKQMQDEIKKEVLAQARDENWASPQTFPSWVSRFRLFGDIRTRFEGDFYPNGNDNTGAFPNFNAINTGAPFDVAGSVFSPQYNVDQNRNRFRLRARVGADLDLGEGFTAGVRVGTGNDNNPVTENQTLGLANGGQGGNFAKYAIWLDRAFIRYETGGTPAKDFTASIGRFDNPFFGTSIIWADDIGFDGVAFRGSYEVAKGVTPFLTAGAFPVFNTDFNFATNNPAKFQSQDKYLYAIQGGTDLKIHDDWKVKVAAAFYDFDNIEGKLSKPFTPLNTTDAGNTDDLRPSFAQNGNTYMALRDIVPTAQNNFGTIDQFQYFGLASPFRELAVTGRVDYSKYDPVHVTATAEFVTNTAFDRADIASKAVNNLGSNGSYAGGPNAWIVDLKIGHPILTKRWDWNIGINYRYVESDSVVDGFTDADFGTPLTGTNLKGYTIYASLALSERTWLFLRWMSADSISGPPYRNDILQFDLNAKF